MKLRMSPRRRLEPTEEERQRRAARDHLAVGILLGAVALCYLVAMAVILL